MSRRLLEEPVLHFLLLGAAIFGAHELFREPEPTETGVILVTRGRIDSLVAAFTRTWQRSPTETELEVLIEDHVREEVLYREALALGLDRDDIIVRRRLRQKLELVTEDIAALAEPSDEELRAFLAAHPDRFRIDERLSFQHVYLNPERHREDLAETVAKLLAELRRAGAQADIAALGDATLIEPRFEDVPRREVAVQLGEKFAARLASITVGEWEGPIESEYGSHLVLVTARTQGRVPALEEAREAVRRELLDARRVESNERFYQLLRERYAVTVERDRPAEEPPGTE